MNNVTKHIFLTGGTGFFGRSLLRYWHKFTRQEYLKVTILSRNPNAFLANYPEFSGHQSITFRKGDIQDRDSLPWNENFTHILHAATDSTLGFRLTPLQRFDQSVGGTRNILDLAVATGAHRFLFISSGAVYGAQPDNLDAIPENWLGAPPLSDTNTAYGQGKRAAEHLCLLMGEEHPLEIVIARCFAFIGQDLPLSAHFAIGNFVRDAISANKITVHGDGTPLRTYLDQHDLAHWLLTLLEHGQNREAYNVGSNEVISIAELASLVRDVLAPGKHIQIESKPTLGAARNRYIPDINKAQKQLGLEVTVPLIEAIKTCGKANLQTQ